MLLGVPAACAPHAPRASSAGAIWPDPASREHCVGEPTWTAVASPRGEGRGGLALQRRRQGLRVRPAPSCPGPPPTRRLSVASPSARPPPAAGFHDFPGTLRRPAAHGSCSDLHIDTSLVGKLPGFYSFSLLTLFLVSFSGYLACCFAFVLLISLHDVGVPGFLSTWTGAGLGGSALCGEGTPLSSAVRPCGRGWVLGPALTWETQSLAACPVFKVGG